MKKTTLKVIKTALFIMVVTTFISIILEDLAKAQWTHTGDVSVQDRLGLGTQTPNYELHIDNSGYSWAWLQVTTKNTGNGLFDGFFWGIESDNTAQFWAEVGMPIKMYPGGAFSTIFKENGRVGIGTSAPAYSLDVTGTINASTSILVDGIEVLTYESDPVFGASAASGITAVHIINWDTAYIWGDHGSAGYLTGEGDPVFSVWDKSTGISIVESQITNLNHFNAGDETDPTVNALGKASLSCTNSQVAKWNGTSWACADDDAGGGASYQSVAVVAQSGGDYTSPLDAMNDLATWCGTASSTNPCLVRVMPGIYDLGNNGLAMQPYVDIEGSGENTTKITSTRSGTSSPISATVLGADNSEIRFLTVENQGGSSFSVAIYNNSASTDITNVTAIASGGTYTYGIRNYYSLPEMTNVIVIASGGTNSYGVENYASSTEMTNVTVTASGGSNWNGGVYNSSTSSSTMTNVTATASGGSFTYGVSNVSSSSPKMVDVSSNGIVITGNQLFVPASGTDLENGALLLSVSNEISGLGTPSSTNRYLIKLDAGTYDLGNNGLVMLSYVDIEGSGENTTTITSTHSSGSYDSTSATVLGADNAEIRFLTVENQGGSSNSIAIYNDSASPDITNVTTTASGGSIDTTGVRNVTSSPVMTNVTATASGGTCAGVSNFTSSPVMTNVTATALGGGSGIGVSNKSNSSPVMTNVTATAYGGTLHYGVSNSSSSPVMSNVTATAYGGSSNYGVWNQFSSPVMTNVTVSASGGTSNNVGVYNHESHPAIKTSSISGTTYSIESKNSSTVRVATTMLDGTAFGTVFTCLWAYDENFATLDSICD